MINIVITIVVKVTSCIVSCSLHLKGADLLSRKVDETPPIVMMMIMMIMTMMRIIMISMMMMSR